MLYLRVGFIHTLTLRNHQVTVCALASAVLAHITPRLSAVPDSFFSIFFCDFKVAPYQKPVGNLGIKLSHMFNSFIERYDSLSWLKRSLQLRSQTEESQETLRHKFSPYQDGRILLSRKIHPGYLTI